MRNQSIFPSLYLGCASGAFAWFFIEVLSIASHFFSIPFYWQTSFTGLFCGGALGCTVLPPETLLSNSWKKTYKKIKYGVLFGAIGGIIFFPLLAIATHSVLSFRENILLSSLIELQQWVGLGVLLGLAKGYTHRKKLLLKYIYAGVISGLGSGLIMLIFLSISPSTLLARGVGLLVFGSALSCFFYYLPLHSKQNWLYALNGSLKGLNTELFMRQYHLGTQIHDEINLIGYKDVHTTHAKLLRYDNEYMLLDNDPFKRTFVNFRPIEEQLLKNGDLIKIGESLFQYCVQPNKNKQKLSQTRHGKK